MVTINETTDNIAQTEIVSFKASPLNRYSGRPIRCRLHYGGSLVYQPNVGQSRKGRSHQCARCPEVQRSWSLPNHPEDCAGFLASSIWPPLLRPHVWMLLERWNGLVKTAYLTTPQPESASSCEGLPLRSRGNHLSRDSWSWPAHQPNWNIADYTEIDKDYFEMIEFSINLLSHTGPFANNLLRYYVLGLTTRELRFSALSQG